MKNFLSRSAWLHLRFAFSLFLLPVFIFALSQAPVIHTLKAILVFFVWHLFIYPASNGYNSYFDKDEGSIALLKTPPKVDISLYYLSLTLDLMGILIAFAVSITFVSAVIIYGLLSKLYSHPAVRLKKYPVTSFLIVFLFQGAFVYWSSYAAVSGLSLFSGGLTPDFLIAGSVCSCLIGASYPLTQVYQHEEDSRRGDRTLSMVLGVKGSFIFSAILFLCGSVLLFLYWLHLGRIINFYIFLVFIVPVLITFMVWFIKVIKDNKHADFKNMSRMTWLSGLMMLFYFLVIWAIG